VFENGTVGSMTLDLPGTISDIEYKDMTGNETTFVNYDSAFEFSRFYYTGKDTKGTSRGRLQVRTLKYSLDEDSEYKTTIQTTNKVKLSYNTFGPYWVDADNWDDSLVWQDADPSYDRVYRNDRKVTVMSGSDHVSIIFSNNDEMPTSGFELETVNFEALFYQRSSRVTS
jgi:hypothetical protein